MKLKLGTTFIVACLIGFGFFQAFAGEHLNDGDFSFCNKSTNRIYVDELLFDNKASDIPCGILIPNSSGTAGGYTVAIPEYFQIKYKNSHGVDSTEKLDASPVKNALHSHKLTKRAEIYFIFTSDEKFILKLYLPSANKNLQLDGLLLPDEAEPAFKAYKELVRAAIDGNTPRVGELMAKGAPYTWPNEPTSLTPLGYAVRWNKKEVFDFLIKEIPTNFYTYDYYNCIKVAAGESYTDILKRLLQSGFAKNIPEFPLQEIFYETCYNCKTPDTLKILLDHFKVGIDYKVRDFGHTLLFVAVQGGNVELVRWLLEQGANPNAKLKNGNTPLRSARDATIRKLLIDHGGQ